MAGDVTLKIDADVAAYIAKVARASAATKGMAKDAGGIGAEVAKSITKMEVLKKAAEAAGRAIAGILDKGTESSKRSGQQALSLASSFGGLGVKDIGKTSNEYLKGSGAASTEERVGFAESLAAVNGRRQAPMSGDEAQKYLDAYRAGGDLVYGKSGSDLSEGASKGIPVEEITRRSVLRRPGLRGLFNDPNNPAMQELGLRSKEDESVIYGDEVRRSAGAQMRSGKAANDLTAANSQGADIFRSLVGAIPGVDQALDAQTGKTSIDGVRDAVDSQTQLLRRAITQPTFGTTTEGR